MFLQLSLLNFLYLAYSHDAVSFIINYIWTQYLWVYLWVHNTYELDQNFVRSHLSDQREGSNLQMLPKNTLIFSLKTIFIFRSILSRLTRFAQNSVETVCFHKISTPGNQVEFQYFTLWIFMTWTFYFLSVGHGVGTNVNSNTTSLNPFWNYDFDIELMWSIFQDLVFRGTVFLGVRGKVEVKRDNFHVPSDRVVNAPLCCTCIKWSGMSALCSKAYFHHMEVLSKSCV